MNYCIHSDSTAIGTVEKRMQKHYLLFEFIDKQNLKDDFVSYKKVTKRITLLDVEVHFILCGERCRQKKKIYIAILRININ